MSVKISVFGLGYVGSVHGCVPGCKGDLSFSKVELMKTRRSPIVEPRMNELVEIAHSACTLHATTDSTAAVMQTEISFLCVGTPSLRSGKLDLGHVEPVGREIGRVLKKKNSFHIVVLRCTVLPGTAEEIVIPALEQSSGKRMGEDFGVCVNPQFMREGTAVADILEPAITILGTADTRPAALLRKLYAWAPGRVFETSFRSAEMVKCRCNGWHALKVAFADEVGTLAKELKVDVDAVTEIFTADDKLNISPSYLKAGFAFGGSCLPKDVGALNYRAKELDLKLPLFESIMPSNHEHLQRAVEMVLATGKRNIAILGLSFKTATDVLRESPQVQLVKHILGEARNIRIWDDNVSLGRLIGSNREYIEHAIPHIGSLLESDLAHVLQDCEAIVIGTRGIPRDQLQSHLRPDHMVVDLVNLEKARRPVLDRYEGMC